MQRRGSRVILWVTLAFCLSLTSGCLFFPRRGDPAGGGPEGRGSVAGVVRDVAGKPVAGVSVTLFNSSAVAVTDAGGRYSFPAVPAGWQAVFVRKEGYLVGSQAVRVADRDVAALDLMLQPDEGHLHGTSTRVPDLCGSCHVLHQQPALSQASVNETCFTCHVAGRPVNFSGSAAYNLTLHSDQVPADNPSPVQLVLPGKPARYRGSCVNCHEPHGINNYHPHLLVLAAQGSSNPLCYTCHNQAGTGHTAGYPGMAQSDAPDNLHMHPTRQDLTYPGSEATAGECYNCHNPHGAIDPVSGQPTTAMTRAEGERLCVQCHTEFASRVEKGTKHACSMCHNPHLIKNGGRILIKPGDTTRRVVVTPSLYTGTHRGVPGVLKNEYCLLCHNADTTNPYRGKAKLPDVNQTAFKNVATESFLSSNPQYRDLHAVHVRGPIGVDSGTTVPNYGRKYCYTPGYHRAVPLTAENKVWCVDCHDVHPSVDSPGNARRRLLRTDLIRTAAVVTNPNGTGYNGKPGCSMDPASQCHRATPARTDGLNGCDWCHQGDIGSPGYSCDCMDTCYGGTDDTGARQGGFDGHGHTHSDQWGVTRRRTVEL